MTLKKKFLIQIHFMHALRFRVGSFGNPLFVHAFSYMYF